MPAQKTRKMDMAPLPQVKTLTSEPIQEQRTAPEKLKEIKEKPINETSPPKSVETISKESSPPKTEASAIIIESTETDDEETTRKWQCPHCGNTNKAQIRELDDKSRLIYSYPKIYAKKYICGQCGKEWK